MAKDGKKAPISLYVVAEKPSGGGKSAVMDFLQEPFISLVEEEIKEIKDIIYIEKEKLKHHLNNEINAIEIKDRRRFKIQKKQIEDKIEFLEQEKQKCNFALPKTNTTPEALEDSLNYTNGFFIAVSDEQSLLDSLVASKKNQSNEVLLKGRNAERVQVLRQSRSGYNGIVTGSFVCFSQVNTIRKIIDASGGTGLFERFLVISEPPFPSKDHTLEIHHDQNLFEDYKDKFLFIKDLIRNPLEYDELTTLTISEEGWMKINEFNNYLEQDFIPNKSLNNSTIQTMAKKSNLQIMSIASNLYLLSEEFIWRDIMKKNIIPDRYVLIAICMFENLLHSALNYFQRNNFIGNKEEVKSIINYFIDKEGSFVAKKISNIIHSLESRKNLNGKRNLIRSTLNMLLDNHILLQFSDGTYVLNPNVRL